ncbi:hypothetical protein SCHPADRAFT_675168 [Schizopora paradoxa]|uniref:Uncharacterized protein n=1 Tax=Schizopora paradoxa TaxID=27342 RepID=A0A0H2RBK5_9AGAM|nr:hypothetical protein SCHPADRAFT_675168 [Schizopora paradoxa]
MLNFSDPESWRFEKITSCVFTSPPKVESESETGVIQWGEASFAGPVHDVIVCEVNGAITFFKFDRNKGPRSLKLLDAEMPMPDFGDFFHPIFTWGDTISRPLMVATDHDGKGEVSVWKVPPTSNI